MSTSLEAGPKVTRAARDLRLRQSGDSQCGWRSLLMILSLAYDRRHQLTRSDYSSLKVAGNSNTHL